MFFKRLELFGFKSFAEKTTVDFEAGVTAVVGPNGCGKSNISDAIKWVLGEQSVRSLRGAKMEDVIFHGADDISPIGFAEVSLTISNQNNLLPLDYEEVTITRRIFRSGESEYRLNKIPVRLKDILELLMDTGLGIPSYSLMEQGRVDQILSSKPEERRSLFEEASGITKYKSKREEALRKLERTGENLQRLGDIIVEVKRQIKSIERQVNKARCYKEEFERLKEYELKVAQYQYQNFRKEKERLETELKQWGHEELELSARMDASSGNLDNTRNDLHLIEEEVSATQTKSFEVNATIRAQEDKISLNQERIEELSRRSGELRQQVEDLGGRIKHSVEQIKQVQDQIEEIKQDKQDKLSFVESKEAEINEILNCIQQTKNEISQERAQEVEIIAQQARKKNDLTKTEANLVNFNARLRRLNMESQNSEEALKAIEEKYQLYTEDLESLVEQAKALTREIWDLRSNLDLELEKKKKFEFRLEDIAHRITAIQSKLSFLKEITEKHEGFSGGVKSILSARDAHSLELTGGFNVVTDLLKVPAPYQVALELALGEDAQAIVVENSQAAEQAINYLKREGLGRAKFICLDSLKLQKPKCAKPDGVLVAAVEVAKVEPKYQVALEIILAATFIVQDLDAACRIIKEINSPGIKLVTLKGEIVTSFSLIAGSVPKDSDLSLLNREEKIAQTEEELKKNEQKKIDCENLKASKDKEIERLSVLIQEKEPNLNKLKVEKAAKENERNNIQTEKTRFADELSVLKLEIEETSEQIQQLQQEKGQLTQQFQELEQKQKEFEQIIQNHQNLIAEKTEQRQTALVEMAEAKTKAANLDREVEQAKRQLSMLVESQSDQQQTLQAREQEAREASKKIQQLNQDIEQFKLSNADLAQTKLTLEQELAKARQRRQSLAATIQELEKHSREGQRKLNEVREKRADLQVRLTEAGYRQNSLTDKMQETYQVDLPAILDGVTEVPLIDRSVLEEIASLKSKLEGMGPVNLVAIEENDQLQQRHSFLISQQEDLINAQVSLRKAISQINHTARCAFAKTFEQIQINFKNYFRLLFNGGDARLILLDENNILESGIEIVVRPPGKKLQNISLLSGGEKALTAISLLFAIFKVKPSPFCILDEVDAPLDEANIDRFTNLLAEFVKISQFIIITHNKKTINMADVMYGITMERSGVSKIVSVKFGEEHGLAARREVAQVEK